MNLKLKDLEAKLDDEKYERDSLLTELKQAKAATKKGNLVNVWFALLYEILK